MNHDILTGKVCPYCSSPTQKADISLIYGRKYAGQVIYICARYPKCDAYVGSYQKSGRPLGRLANRELREWKVKAHNAFDPLWKSGDMSRMDAYKWLAGKLKIPVKECHIGMFDVRQCKKVVEVMREDYFV